MKNRQLSLIFFLIIQIYIYVLMICFDHLVNVNLLSCISIALCFVIAIFMFCKTKDYYIMISAFFLTLCARLCSLFLDNNVVPLILLNITQIFYFLRIYIDSEYKKLNVMSRISIFPIIILSFFVLKNKFDIEAILWIILMVNIFFNTIFSIKEIGINNFFPIGLLLYFVYGAFLMLYNIHDYLVINIYLINMFDGMPFDFKEVFYLPTQVVLTCSIFTVNRKFYKKTTNII